jgi:hypothetical protein
VVSVLDLGGLCPQAVGKEQAKTVNTGQDRRSWVLERLARREWGKHFKVGVKRHTFVLQAVGMLGSPPCAEFQAEAYPHSAHLCQRSLSRL